MSNKMIHIVDNLQIHPDHQQLTNRRNVRTAFRKGEMTDLCILL